MQLTDSDRAFIEDRLQVASEERHRHERLLATRAGLFGLIGTILGGMLAIISAVGANVLNDQRVQYRELAQSRDAYVDFSAKLIGDCEVLQEAYRMRRNGNEDWMGKMTILRGERASDDYWVGMQHVVERLWGDYRELERLRLEAGLWNGRDAAKGSGLTRELRSELYMVLTRFQNVADMQEMGWEPTLWEGEIDARWKRWRDKVNLESVPLQPGKTADWRQGNAIIQSEVGPDAIQQRIDERVNPKLAEVEAALR